MPLTSPGKTDTNQIFDVNSSVPFLHINAEKTREFLLLTSKPNDPALITNSPVPHCNPEGVGGHQAVSATSWRTYSTKESARGDQKRANSAKKKVQDTNCFSQKGMLSHRKTNFISKKKKDFVDLINSPLGNI